MVEFISSTVFLLSHNTAPSPPRPTHFSRQARQKQTRTEARATTLAILLTMIFNAIRDLTNNTEATVSATLLIIIFTPPELHQRHRSMNYNANQMLGINNQSHTNDTGARTPTTRSRQRRRARQPIDNLTFSKSTRFTPQKHTFRLTKPYLSQGKRSHIARQHISPQRLPPRQPQTGLPKTRQKQTRLACQQKHTANATPALHQCPHCHPKAAKRPPKESKNTEPPAARQQSATRYFTHRNGKDCASCHQTTSTTRHDKTPRTTKQKRGKNKNALRFSAWGHSISIGISLLR